MSAFGPKKAGRLRERMITSLLAELLQGNIKNTEVVKDFESCPHKAVTFLVERDKDSGSTRVKDAKNLARIQWW